MKRSVLQLVLVVMVAAAPALAHAQAEAQLSPSPSPSVAGTVRDAAGQAQIGVLVQLLTQDSAVLASAYSDSNGHYELKNPSPGTFQVRATSTMFLPALRKDIPLNLGAQTLLDLTLNTLTQVLQWLPARPRTAADPDDDWKWTLRSPVNRPVLRDFDPTIVLASTRQEGKARSPRDFSAHGLVFSQTSGFAASGVHQVLTLDHTKVRQHDYWFRADIVPSAGQSASATALTQFEEAPGQLTRVAANYQYHTDLLAGGALAQESTGSVMGSGIVRVVHTSQLGPGVQLETGSEIEQVGWVDRVAASHPFVAVELHPTETMTINYGVSTAPEFGRADDVDATIEHTPMVAPSARGLALEHGIHQQLQWTRDTGSSSISLLYFHDQVDDPILQGTASAAAFQASQMVAAFDAASNLFREAGNSFSAQGVGMAVGHQFEGIHAQLSLLKSDGLGLTSSLAPALGRVATRAIPGELAEVTLDGMLPSARTRWKVSYGAETSGMLTPLNNFDREGPSPYLNFAIHQPLHANNLEALVEVRNLLAQGYHPYLSADGDTVYFLQVPRSLQGGLVFSF